MKTSELERQKDQFFLAKIEGGPSRGKVKVLEVGIPRPFGRARRGHPQTMRADGVRVLLMETLNGYRVTYDEGTEYVVPSFDVERKWTADDERHSNRRAVNEARAGRIAEAFAEAGVDAQVHAGRQVVTLTFDSAETLLGMEREEEGTAVPVSP